MGLSSFGAGLTEVESMKRISIGLMMILTLGFALILPGCNSRTPVTNVLVKKGTQVTLVRQTVKIPPQRVVDESLRTLNQLQLKNIKSTQTAVDAVFEFTSARSRNYRLIVTGIGLDTTRIEIQGFKNPVDQEQANLVYDAIERNLFTNR